MNALVPLQKPEDEADNWTFDWRADPSIVCEEQPALAVYTNPRGQCVIRQEQRWDEHEDTVILVCPENALRVAWAILAAVGMGDIEFVRPCGGGGYEDVPIRPVAPTCREASQPKDPTAAARQRRRRAKLKEQRDAATELTVTDRDDAESALPLRLVAAE